MQVIEEDKPVSLFVGLLFVLELGIALLASSIYVCLSCTCNLEILKTEGKPHVLQTQQRPEILFVGDFRKYFFIFRVVECLKLGKHIKTIR